jgi:hypothetical protein
MGQSKIGQIQKSDMRRRDLLLPATKKDSLSTVVDQPLHSIHEANAGVAGVFGAFEPPTSFLINELQTHFVFYSPHYNPYQPHIPM